jgi:ribosomal protein S1
MLKAFVGAVALSVALSGAAFAADVEGKIKSVDATGKTVTLDDGTKLAIPPTLAVEKKALKPGANVKASYEEKGGEKVATSFMVMPSR